MIRPTLFALILFFSLGACASTGAQPTEDWTASNLTGTEWSEICPDGDPERTRLELRADGTFAYRYPGEGWEHDGDETWRIEGDDLVISWNDGFAVSRYRLTRADRLVGTTTKSCETIYLERASR